MTENEQRVAMRRAIRIMVETVAIQSALMQADRFMIEKINSKVMDLDELNQVFMQLLSDHSAQLQELIPRGGDDEPRIISPN